MKNMKLQNEDFEIEFEIIPIDKTETKSHCSEDIAEIDGYLAQCQRNIDKYNEEIERLTNQADWLDYTVAVASGVITGLIDVFIVGQLDLEACNKWGSDKVNNFVKKVAGEKGNDPDALKRAIKKLEDKTKIGFASDSNLNDFGGGKQHHLRDFAHHPTLVGWIFSLLTQFTENCYGTDTNGVFIVVPVKDKTRIGANLQQKIVYGTVLWFLHLVSDMAGTSDNVGKGTGIPGPLLSLAKELSVLPPFNKMKVGDMEISTFLSKLFNGTLYAKRDSNGKLIKESIVPIDLRTELGIIKTQAMPVIINEVIVRTFYAIRRTMQEIKEHPISCFNDLKELNWKKIIPFKNRTIVRMLTISTGTFTTIDMAHAAIQASKAGTAGGAVAFASSFLLNVNFVGIGRCVMAIGTDVTMGIKRSQLMNKRIVLLTERLNLLNCKILYRQQEQWIAAEDAGKTLLEIYKQMEYTIDQMSQNEKETMKSLNNIQSYVDGIENKNPGLVNDMLSVLHRGGRL